ncbi:formate hydrogenlyase maturation protein HycH [Campylobacter sputorum subsp. bubulus]|uniref:Formate hydrogenlyase maturation protein HycH n=1 Tax=Campylobacter sputorum subsp. sputorum TaxID=32024 RepID=A0A381DJ29_9BACT|nr:MULTISPECIES: formate hydrogenlyase maturation HycH family protein [Campylobacter]ASM35708.1 formate hydrogenlyase family maturation protein [Campylobacter sputorum aubsp. sputorum RM3237]ASM37426.1 formate hydrogenlyase family maturation protein [Campylobacter sputorum bv. faecalis CCUG 20703]ASM39090.1 formate hydrogenlyase family maturation protein [Campylobacter sputorum bv. paraureolyticus LMG 11764]ASM40674.1 formate hydrogenlyase family maturation protein [Campylobacter sputorum]KAB0
MVEVHKLTKRHLDGEKINTSKASQIKIFSTCIGHGVGTIDFSEKILEISDEEYEKILNSPNEYIKFKIGNLSRYFEIEIFPEHAKRLVENMIDCKFKEILSNLHEGYLVLRKDFVGIKHTNSGF